MKNKIFIIVALILALSCITGIIVSASADNVSGEEVTTTEAPVVRETVLKDRIYYAYYNSASQKGAVAFCLSNKFTAYGTSENDIQLCTKNEDGTYTVLHTVTKDNLTTWFAGKQEYSVNASDNLSALLGGLDSVGITLDCEKTNIAFALNNQSIEKGVAYYICIPEDYYVNAQGEGNMAEYIEIDSAAVNNYTGTICGDFETIANSIYDIALFGVESLASIVD